MLKLFKNLEKKEYLFIFLAIIFIVIQVLLDLKLPDYMSNITVLVQSSGSQGEILTQGLYMLLCALGSLVTSVIVGYLATFVASKFGFLIRSKIYRKILNFSTKEIKEFSIASLITRTTNDVGQVQMLISFGLQALIKAPIMAFLAIIKIAGKNMTFSWLTFLTVVILLILIIIIVSIVIPRFKIVQKLTDNLNRIARENLTGIRVVRAFNADNYQEDKFNQANQNLTNTQLFNQRVMGIMSPFMSLMMSSLTLAIYLVGAILINEADITSKLSIFSDMVVFSSYAMQVVMSFMMLVMIFLIYPRASVSAKRILEVLERKNTILDGKGQKPKEKGTIEFKNVSFKYPDADEYILKDISFKALKGETIAFIGGTGSGKSTLINLIPRFYDVTSGEVLVSGVNVKDYKLTDLHNLIGYVSQKAFMFSSSVYDNITYGKTNHKITKEAVSKALEVSQASSFVNKMSDGINSFIARGGTNVSGGQKQRLSIARAVSREPEIYIFDDTFSALDYQTDFKLRQELRKYTKEATVLIVAQRIGTIIDASKIVVLDEGKIVDIGTHQELLARCPLYKEIAISQLEMEELQ